MGHHRSYCTEFSSCLHARGSSNIEPGKLYSIYLGRELIHELQQQNPGHIGSSNGSGPEQGPEADAMGVTEEVTLQTEPSAPVNLESDYAAQAPAHTSQLGSRLLRRPSHQVHSRQTANVEATASSMEVPSALPDHTNTLRPARRSSRMPQSVQPRSAPSHINSSEVPLATVNNPVTSGPPPVHQSGSSPSVEPLSNNTNSNTETNAGFPDQPREEEFLYSSDPALEDELIVLSEKIEAAGREVDKARRAYLTALSYKRACQSDFRDIKELLLRPQRNDQDAETC